MAINSKFSIVLVNYKTPQMTRICMEFLYLAIAPFNVDVWVVDNDSADASTEFLRKLGWIKLIERKPEHAESGRAAHGRALDLALAKIETEYVFVMHTDTIIYNGDIFEMMTQLLISNPNIAAAGCLEQVNRGAIRFCWRKSKLFIKCHYRLIKLALGIKSKKPPKEYDEHYLKSFCTLWNAKILKQHGLSFSLGKASPGYMAQDQLLKLGYKVNHLPPSIMFRYLDHIQGGTKTFGRGTVKDHRLRKNLKFIEELSLAT